METRIHPSALVEPGARLGAGVEVGPLAYVGRDVELGEGCVVMAHAVVCGCTTAGKRNRFFPGSAVGLPSQDLTGAGEVSYLTLGDDNIIREHVTLNAGTVKERRTTVIGSRNNIMSGAHVAHDCHIGDDCVIANNVLLGGHVRIGSRVGIGGAAALHHFVRIGDGAFLAGMARAEHDVPPFLLAGGSPCRVRGANVVGLERRGTPPEEIAAVKEICRRLFRSDGDQGAVLKELEEREALPGLVRQIVRFLQQQRAGRNGRALERYRRPDGTVDLEALEQGT